MAENVYWMWNAKYAQGPSGLKPPLRWGTDGLHDLLGAGTEWIHSEERTALQYYRSVDHALEVFLTYVGPAIRTLEASDAQSQNHFRLDLKEVFDRYNRATDGTAVIENRYLLTVAARA